MKKNILIPFAIVFSYLFYKQSLGINVLLFIPFILGVTYQLRYRLTPYAIALLISSIGIFINPSFSSILMCFLSLSVVIGKRNSDKIAIYLATFNGVLNSIIGSFEILINPSKNQTSKSKTPFKFWFITLLIVIPILGLFIVLYRNANPIFNEYVEKIDLSFINIGFILTSIGGFIFLLNISHPILKKEIEEIEHQTPSTLSLPSEPLNKIISYKLKYEHLQATILISILNFLLILFLFTDMLLFNDSEAMMAFKDNVHNSVYTLIISIICAITIISIYFRGNLNFYKNNRVLKKLSYLWIGLNLLLVISTLYKNWYYIFYHGLTFKRIGVIVYLILVVVGLYYTFRKIQHHKTFWFILKKSSLFGFFLFTLLATIPYGKLVTYYNLNSKATIDVDYLLRLPHDNAMILWNLQTEVNRKTNENLNKILLERVKSYETTLEGREWQSYSLDNFIFKK